jgi:hypothetical protein
MVGSTGKAPTAGVGPDVVSVGAAKAGLAINTPATISVNAEVSTSAMRNASRRLVLPIGFASFDDTFARLPPDPDWAVR